jgi:hypothetical protein
MGAKIVRVIDYGERQHVVLEGDRGRYHLTLQTAKDHNGNSIGHKSWLRRENVLYPSQDAAIDAALEDVDRLEGARPAPAAVPSPTARSQPGHTGYPATHGETATPPPAKTPRFSW